MIKFLLLNKRAKIKPAILLSAGLIKPGSTERTIPTTTSATAQFAQMHVTKPDSAEPAIISE